MLSYCSLLNFIPIQHFFLKLIYWLNRLLTSYMYNNKWKNISFTRNFFLLIPNYKISRGSSSREVEYQISYTKDVRSIPTHSIYSFNFHRKTLRKPPENLRKLPENLRTIPKMAENYGNPTVFLQPTNRKHIPLNGQFGLASSDYMYGIQRPEFSQCAEGFRVLQY